MSLRSRRCLQLLLPMIAAMCLSAAPQQQLNPTVKVLPAATSTVPPECEEGLAPQPRPRVTAEEKAAARQVIAPPEMQAPPSNDLRTTLRDVQTAAERNDRASFIDSLARAKTILTAYPTGGERAAAEKAMAVFNDINTLWDYQLTPAGSFFDASSDLFKMLSAYPGYDTFIRRQVLVDQAGAKFYPSSESRAFLTQIAADRLKDLGIKSTAARMAAPPPAVQTTSAPAVHEKAAVIHERAPRAAQTASSAPAPHKRHVMNSAPKTQRAAKATGSKHKPLQVASAKPAPQKKPVEATSAPKSASPEKTPTVAAKTVSTASTKSAAPATTTQAEPPVASTTKTVAPAVTDTGTTPAPQPATTASVAPSTVTASDTAVPATTAATGSEATSTAIATDTTATADTASTDTTGTGEKEQPGRPGEPRNLLWPIILIVVGVGVLILLFRTSPGPK